MQVQRCTLLSIKTGGCPETCNYCAQSSSWSKDVGLKAEKLMDLEPVYEVDLAFHLADGHSTFSLARSMTAKNCICLL